MDKKIRIHFIRKNLFQKKSFSEKLFFRKNLPMSYRKPNTIFYSERKINSWEKLFYSSGTEWKRKTEKCGKPNAFFLFFRRKKSSYVLRVENKIRKEKIHFHVKKSYVFLFMCKPIKKNFRK